MVWVAFCLSEYAKKHHAHLLGRGALLFRLTKRAQASRELHVSRLIHKSKIGIFELVSLHSAP